MLLAKRINSMLTLFGVDPSKARKSICSMPRYIRQGLSFRAKVKADKMLSKEFPFGKLYPCLHDYGESSGSALGHYFHQDILVARKIFESNPERHVDIGSRVDGFVAHVACFRQIDVIDIRPLVSEVKNIAFMQANLMNPVPQDLLGCCDSLSCLHTLEHFGLGRYGDPLEPNGHLCGIRNLARIVRQGGTLYLSVPIGSQRIEFNAHRVFNVAYMLKVLEQEFQLRNFSYIDDLGCLHENVAKDQEMVDSNFGCVYGCGILELVKN